MELLAVVIVTAALSAVALAIAVGAFMATRDSTPQKLRHLVENLAAEVAEFRSGHESREIRFGELSNGVLSQIEQLGDMIENLEASARKKKNAANRLEGLQNGAAAPNPATDRDAAREFFRSRGLPA